VTWPADMVGRTIADGQRTTHIGRIPFELLRRYLDGIVTVSDDEIARAMVRASREARLGAGAVRATTLAAWLFHVHELPASGRVVAILSGGNVDPVRYDELLAAESRPAGDRAERKPLRHQRRTAATAMAA